MRSKEMAHDYRYFPDPDLMPVKVDDTWRGRLQAECPELPFDKQRRFIEQYQVPYTITSVLVPELELSNYFEETAKLSGKPQAVANWIVNDLLRELGNFRSVGVDDESKNFTGKIGSLNDLKIRPAHIAALVKLVDAGTIINNVAKAVFLRMFATGEMPSVIVEKEDLQIETNLGELEQWCRDAIAANPKALAEFKAGKDSAINAFKGPVMKAAKGKANPKLVDETLRRLLSRM